MTLLYFIIILGVIIFIHELGHFISAKKSGIYVYEFSLGMGPRILKFNRKNDETFLAKGINCKCGNFDEFPFSYCFIIYCRSY